MNKILLIIICFIAFESYGQKLPMVDDKVMYRDVMEFPDKNKSEILSAVELWMAHNFQDSRSVKELVDKEGGVVVGNGLFSGICAKNGFGVKKCNSNVKYQMTIEVKEQKLRYSITNFSHYFDPGETTVDGGALEQEKPPGKMSGMQNKIWDQIKLETDKKTNELIKSLQSSIKGKNDDW